MLRITPRRLTAGLAGTLAALAAAAPAHAATATWSCSADALTATVAGLSPVNPITASRTPCADQSTGLPNTTDALGLAPTINAKSAYAITTAKPNPARPIQQTVGSASGVEGLSIVSGGTTILGVDAVRTQIVASCKNDAPVFTPTADAVGVTVGGQKISLDKPLIQITDALSGALGKLIEIRVNEQVRDAAGLTIRGLHVKVLNVDNTPLLDVVVAESKVSSASACDPKADGNVDPNGASGSDLKNICASGSSYDVQRNACIIPASASGGQGVVVIGPPYSGPSGGKVISLTLARKRYKSPCLQGDGPKYAIVGTNRRNRITGTNVADRILGLGGNDALDGGRGNDCLDGGTGGDTLSGALGNDRAYGFSGKDHLNGGPGNDYLSAGTGNDTINTSFGRDVVSAGTGRDFINSATAGSPARINCGGGQDIVRINRNERSRLKGCETVYVFADK
jgi:hypothetical protein